MSTDESKLPKLPIGKQSIVEILQNGFLYMDKTQQIYNLITKGAGVYFLSRPRRFGKSLLISTLEQIFLGNKELFKQQWIYGSDYEWKEYPIIRLDMSKATARKVDKIEYKLHLLLDQLAQDYQIDLKTKLCETKFAELIRKLHEKYKNKVVILVDEYDKPLIDNIKNLEVAEEVRNFLRDFYTIIKSNDEYIGFIFITGVSKFSKTSIFSGLNNLNDLTQSRKAATLLGITQEELEQYFHEHIIKLSKARNESKKKTLKSIQAWYNGYRFTNEDVRVYNPFSTLSLFDENEFNNYWVDTAIPSFLIDLLKEKGDNLQKVIERKRRNSVFSSYELDKIKPHLLLFQTGYLTIKDYDEENRFYYLDFPNKEVQETFNELLIESYTGVEEATSYLYEMKEMLYSNDLKSFFNTMKTFFAGNENTIILDEEKYYQSIFYTILRLLGVYIEVEVSTNVGRIDTVIYVRDVVYIIEFKLDGTAQEALDQIKQKEYYQKYQRDDRQIVLVGVNFSQKKRNIDEYLVETV